MRNVHRKEFTCTLYANAYKSRLDLYVYIRYTNRYVPAAAYNTLYIDVQCIYDIYIYIGKHYSRIFIYIYI